MTNTFLNIYFTKKNNNLGVRSLDLYNLKMKGNQKHGNICTAEDLKRNNITGRDANSELQTDSLSTLANKSP